MSISKRMDEYKKADKYEKRRKRQKARHTVVKLLVVAGLDMMVSQGAVNLMEPYIAEAVGNCGGTLTSGQKAGLVLGFTALTAPAACGVIGLATDPIVDAANRGFDACACLGYATAAWIKHDEKDLAMAFDIYAEYEFADEWEKAKKEWIDSRVEEFRNGLHPVEPVEQKEAT